MNTIYKLLSICGAFMVVTSCEDLKFGNSFLETPNTDAVVADTVFKYKKYADQALNQAYKSLPDFMPSLRACHPEGFILENYTDIGYSSRIPWVTGSVTSSSGTYNFPYMLVTEQLIGDPTYGIRKSYIYLENVDRVVDMTDEEKKVRKAEMKAIIGLHYTQLIRYWGGMPWIDHAYLPDETFKFSRMTIENTVQKTVDLLDEAANELPWSVSDDELGHLTAAMAKALKMRILLFAASPLFNAAEPYLGGEAADQKITWYGNYDVERWRAALTAGRDFIRLNNSNGSYYKLENTGNPQEDYVNAYFTRGSKEVLLYSFRWPTYEWGLKSFRMYEDGYGAPRAKTADMFQWKDGSTFDWNNPEHAANPFFDAAGNPTRDVRLYETLVVNQDKWQGRKAEVYEGGREGTGTGSLFKLKSQYGYGFRKFVRDKADEMHRKPYGCPLFRLPEIYLSIAEAMNELGEASVKDEFGCDAYDYLNMVRERAGLTNKITAAEVAPGEALRYYLLDERAREFGQEDMRYHDVVRWKKGDWISEPLTMLTTTKNADGTFTYVNEKREDIKYMWNDAWYLIPFNINEINKKYGLVQNPGW